MCNKAWQVIQLLLGLACLQCRSHVFITAVTASLLCLVVPFSLPTSKETSKFQAVRKSRHFQKPFQPVPRPNFRQEQTKPFAGSELLVSFPNIQPVLCSRSALHLRRAKCLPKWHLGDAWALASHTRSERRSDHAFMGLSPLFLQILKSSVPSCSHASCWEACVRAPALSSRAIYATDAARGLKLTAGTSCCPDGLLV